MTLIDPKFRRQMIDHPELVRRSVLSDVHIELFKYICERTNNGEHTQVVDVAYQFNISNGTAHKRLKRLCKGGYLLVERPHMTYLYKVAI